VSPLGDVNARMIPLPVWSDRHTVACRRRPAVVAVWEGAGGRLALLLRHTVFPLPTERTSWLIETADAACPVIDDLRRAGCWGAPIVLNWRPLATIAHVARTWRLRYDADPNRRAELLDAVDVHLADQHASAAPLVAPTRPAPVDVPALRRLRVLEWYGARAGEWLGAEPTTRRHLILGAQRWIARHVLAGEGTPSIEGLDDSVRAALVADLNGALTAAERATWRRWILELVASLDRALRCPSHRRDEAWARWLFMIPCIVQPPPAPASAAATA
jgi:hypothetical protein